MRVAGTPFASLPPAPPIAICVLAARELAINGPSPCPCAGVHTPRHTHLSYISIEQCS